MIQRPAFLLVLPLALACASTETSRPPAPPAHATAATATTAAAPAPDAGVHGVDVAGMDRSVAPGDDFFMYANGGWYQQTEIPADSSRWGTFNILADQATRRTRELLEAAANGNAAAGSEERKLGDFYASYLDEGAVESRGLEPL